jgi:hypothetical protein
MPLLSKIRKGKRIFIFKITPKSEALGHYVNIINFCIYGRLLNEKIPLTGGIFFIRRHMDFVHKITANFLKVNQK